MPRCVFHGSVATMSKKDRKAKPHFRVQGLERRVLLSATWMDGAESSNTPTLPLIDALANDPSSSAEMPIADAVDVASAPPDALILRFDLLASEEIALSPAQPHYTFDPIQDIDLDIDSDWQINSANAESIASLPLATNVLDSESISVSNSYSDSLIQPHTTSDPNELLAFTTSTGQRVAFADSEYLVGGSDHLLRVDFVGANLALPVQQGADSDQITLDSQSADYRNVLYTDLWADIDVVFESDTNTLLKSTYYIDAGVSVDNIHLQYNQQLSIDEAGNLVMHFENGTMNESAPIAWQDIDGMRHYIEVAFRLIGDNELGFVVGDYDAEYELVIDPTLTWNSFVGGSGNDYIRDIAIDSSGNVYVVGDSSATWGSPIRAYSTTSDTFVAKFNGSGALQWNTFLGGSGNSDVGTAITVDASGNAFVTGWSNATWGTPVTGFAGGSFDAYVAKLNTSGTLQWNTFVGGTGIDATYGIVTDSSGNVYVSGNSNVTWGSPVRAYSSGEDGFIAKLSSTGSLTWNSFIGGTGNDRAEDLAVDASGNVYGVGYSTATWGSPVRAYSSGQDGIAFKLTNTGALSWNTFLGGSGIDYNGDIAIDSSGNSYVTGYSNATWGTPITAYNASYDGTVSKLNSSGTLQWNTFIGSSANDAAYGIVIDPNSNLIVSGGADASIGSPWRSYTSGTDAFVAFLNTNGTRGAIGYYGSTGTDVGNGIATDGNGNVYLGGYSNATWGTPTTSYNSGYDGFVAKIASNSNLVTNTNDSGVGSLRQAMTDANGIAGTDTIQFDIATSDSGYNKSGAGTFIIQPTTALPTITDPVIINATTQSQYVSSPVIELDGSNAGAAANGFNITGGGTTIKGFAIYGFAEGSGIYVNGSGLNNIDGNIIGLRPNGSDSVEGTVAWWKGESNGNDSTSTNTATLTGGVTYATGKVGTAFHFDGTGHLSVTDNIQLDIPQAITLEAWANFSSLSNPYNTILAKESSVATRNYLISVTQNGAIHLSYGNASAANVNVTTVDGVISTGQWYHIVGVIDTVSGTMGVYVNGTLVQSGATSGAMITSTSDLRIGGATNGTTSRMTGLLDEVAIYNRALSTTEINAAYNAGLNGKSAAKIPLVSTWSGEGNANDTRSINNGTLTNGATTTASGKLFSAFSLDGVDDYVSITDSSSFGNTGVMSVSAWVNPDLIDATDPRDIVSQWNAGATQRAFMMRLNTNGKILFYISRDGGTDYDSIQSSLSLNASSWQHVVGTYDGAEIRVYINGQLSGTLAYAGSMFNSNGNILIGDSNASNGLPFDGRVDEVSLYNRALTATEVANLYQYQSTDTNTFVATPIASYKAEGNESDFTSTNEGTLNGGVTYVSGIAGKAFDFDGTSGYISAPDHANLEVSNAVTLAAWINADDIANFRQIISKFGSAGHGAYQLGLAPNGALRADFSSDGAAYYGLTSSSSLLTAGTWYHVAATFNSGTALLYINGVQVANATTGFSTIYGSGTANLNIGRASSASQFFDGRIDEAVIYNRALSAAEIGSLFSSVAQSTVGNNIGINLVNSSGNEVGGVTAAERNIISGNTLYGIQVSGNGTPKDAVAWWKSDGNANDSVGSLNGTLTNGATATSTGVNGSAFQFDGVDDYVQVGTSSSLAMTNMFTVETWIYPNNTTGGDFMIFNREGEYELARVGSTGEIRWAIANSSNTWFFTGTGYNAPANTWTHLALTFDNGTVKLFANGVQVYSGTISSSTIGDANPALNEFRIASRQNTSGTDYFQGKIDDLAIYRRALTATEISTIYRVGGGTKGGNTIAGNYIGVDESGTQSRSNGSHGIYVLNSSGNTIGGTTSASKNVISGNSGSGVFATGTSTFNVIQSNYIGTNSSGTAKVANAASGIYLVSTTSYNTIGGTLGTDGNLISGNGLWGICLEGNNNTVQGNFIGTNFNGTSSLGNTWAGIGVLGSGNTIGGTTASARNIISGGTAEGIYIHGNAATSNVVYGNYVGVDVTGAVSLPNSYGIALMAGATGNFIGGTGAGMANVISGNNSRGIYVYYSGVSTSAVASLRSENNAQDFISLNQGTWTGTASYTTGKIGNALDLTGSNYITIPNESVFDFSDQVFTVEGWFKTTASGSRQMIVNKGNGASNYQWDVEIGTDNLLYAVFLSPTNNNVYAKYTSTTVNDGQWHHFAAKFDTRTTTENIELFLDGQSQTSVFTDLRASLNYNTSGNDPLMVGSRNGSFNFVGQIDELNIYSRDLSTAEITKQYTTGSVSKYGNVIQGNIIGRNAANTANVANGSSGIELYNSAGNIIGGTAAGEANIIRGNAGDGVSVTGIGQLDVQAGWWRGNDLVDQINGGTATGVNSPSYTTGVDGVSASAFNLNGINQYISIPDSSALDMTTAVTMDAWVNMTNLPSSGNYYAVIVKSSVVADRNYGLWINSAGQLYTEWAGTLGPAGLTSSAAIAAGSWAHIASVIDPTTSSVKLYINGALVSSTNAPGGLVANNAPLMIGASESSSPAAFFKGAIDDVGVYGRALSAAEITTIFEQRTNGKTIGSQSNAIRGNVISGNGDLAIDLSNNGVTANDAAPDNDLGPNGLQNYPIINTVSVTNGNTTIRGSLSSKANTTYTLDFYSNSAADSSGYGEALTYLGSTTVTTDGSGAATYLTTLSGVSASGFVSATATENLGGSNYGGTSEMAFTTTSLSTISGKVFDDVNYGGGAGRDYATADSSAVSSGFTAGAIGRSGATVELYDASGNFIVATTTDSNGNYSFNVNTGVNYSVRVVNSTVSSVRGGAGLIGVQTYQASANGTSTTAITNYVGGDTPSEVDAAANNGSQTLSFLDTQTGIDAQSVANITAISGNIANVDFGFNFSTVVNTNDSGQGSLRQFINNAVSLSNANLAQAGQAAGNEVSIFMISDGQAHAGLRAGLTNLLTGTVGVDARAVISLASALPSITGANATNTIIDATTQTANVGNTNVGTVGVGGAASMTVGVGIDGIAGTADDQILNAFARPEIEINGNAIAATMLTVSANNFGLKGTSWWGHGGVSSSGLAVTTGSGHLIQDNLFGANALGTAQAQITTGQNQFINLGAAVTGATVLHNYVTAASQAGSLIGIYPNIGSTNITLDSNEFTGVMNYATPFYTANSTATRNYFHNLTNYSIISVYGPFANQTIEHNTISNTAQGINLSGTSSGTVRYNLITGVTSTNGAVYLTTDSQAVTVTRNSIYGNAGLGIDNYAISSINNGTIVGTQPNSGIDSPVITSAVLNGSTLTVSGYIGIAAGDTDFANATIEVFKAAVDASRLLIYCLLAKCQASWQ